jgi:hypothetical protein
MTSSHIWSTPLKLTKRVMAVAVIIVIMLAQVHKAEPAAAIDWTVNEFNMNTNFGSATFVVDWVDFQHPQAILLVEVCQSHAEYLKNQLGARGYAASTSVRNYVTTFVNSSVCGGENRGNAVFLVGNNQTATYFSLDPQDPNDNTGEVRRSICNRTNTFLGVIAACSSHMTKNGGGYAQFQSLVLRSTMSDLYPGVRKWGGGDFNLRPPFSTTDSSRIVPTSWYDHYHDANYASSSPPWLATTDTGITIDYIFGAKNTFTIPGARATYAVTTSDHRFYWAQFYS